jgi:hypothetical protein
MAAHRIGWDLFQSSVAARPVTRAARPVTSAAHLLLADQGRIITHSIYARCRRCIDAVPIAFGPCAFGPIAFGLIATVPIGVG